MSYCVCYFYNQVFEVNVPKVLSVLFQDVLCTNFRLNQHHLSFPFKIYGVRDGIFYYLFRNYKRSNKI